MMAESPPCNNLYRPFYFVSKRIFDILFSSIAIAMLFPLYILIALSVLYDSPGPVFFRGERSGKNGTVFRIYKFRTMYSNASMAQMTTSVNDQRITNVGKVLRKYKLDELPQFFNVLQNDMSVVGPRPELPYYTRRYSLSEKIILSVKPGITDYASVEFADLNNLISDVGANQDYENNILKKKNMLRIKYVENCSFMTDLHLISKTLLRVMHI